MGCDIHTMAEVLYTPRKYRVTGPPVEGEPRWRGVKRPVFTNPYYDPRRAIDPFSSYGNQPYCKEPYKGRDYALFSVLADVRNNNPGYNIFDPSMRYEVRESLLPVSQPRGVPDDASEEWKKYVAQMGMDLHSMSYFTLTELLQAVRDGAFSQLYENGGYIPVEQYRRLKLRYTKPTVWAGWSSNGISEEEFLSMPAKDRAAFTGMVATRWTDNTEFPGFLNVTIPELMRLAPFMGKPDWQALQSGAPDTRERDTDKVRFVFGFDN